ncbi:MAG: Gx transporter family protein [Oscillospiraceae bacterium]
MNNDSVGAKNIAFMGLLFALTLVLSFAEYNILPPLPINGVKLGLSNIVIMYCVVFESKGSAFYLGVLKSIFVASTRGVIAGAISLFGGMLSIIVMSIAYKFQKENQSYAFISILGGVSHNIGQIICASLILKSTKVFYYVPVLIVAGFFVGFATATILKILVPYIKKIK